MNSDFEDYQEFLEFKKMKAQMKIGTEANSNANSKAVKRKKRTDIEDCDEDSDRLECVATPEGLVKKHEELTDKNDWDSTKKQYQSERLSGEGVVSNTGWR